MELLLGVLRPPGGGGGRGGGVTAQPKLPGFRAPQSLSICIRCWINLPCLCGHFYQYIFNICFCFLGGFGSSVGLNTCRSKTRDRQTQWKGKSTCLFGIYPFPLSFFCNSQISLVIFSQSPCSRKHGWTRSNILYPLFSLLFEEQEASKIIGILLVFEPYYLRMHQLAFIMCIFNGNLHSTYLIVCAYFSLLDVPMSSHNIIFFPHLLYSA